MTSTFHTRKRRLHVAIIMDGNGRWAEQRGMAREEGHRAGALAVRRVVHAAVAHDVPLLTLFAFSSDNWRRPRREVSNLMRVFLLYLRSECALCERDGVRVTVIGRRDRLPQELVRQIEVVEERTRGEQTLWLQVAVDYSSLDSIVAAAGNVSAGRPLTRASFREAMLRAVHAPPGFPEVDLLLRTGGEQRLSDFLLWECAYAEMVFTSRLWPDFAEADLSDALREFAARSRRFGAIAPSHVLEEVAP